MTAEISATTMAYEVWGFVHIMDRVATRAKYRLELWDRYSSQLFGLPAWFFDCVSCERFFDKLERLTYCLGDAEIEDDKVTALVCHAEMLEIVQLYGEALGRGSPVNRVRFVQFCWHTFLDHGELRCFGPKRIGVRSISALELYGECSGRHSAGVAQVAQVVHALADRREVGQALAVSSRQRRHQGTHPPMNVAPPCSMAPSEHFGRS